MPVSFEIYLKSYIEEQNYPRRGCFLAIETLDGKHIGNCSYFSLDDIKQETEMGIMIGDKTYWDQGYGTDTISTLLNHIFSQAGMRRIHLRTLDWNKRAQTCFTKCGFVPCGQLIQGNYHFIIMEIRRQTNSTKSD
jgi:RimJ/RimL family protein N-acetyltransferase